MSRPTVQTIPLPLLRALLLLVATGWMGWMCQAVSGETPAPAPRKAVVLEWERQYKELETVIANTARKSP